MPGNSWEQGDDLKDIALSPGATEPYQVVDFVVALFGLKAAMSDIEPYLH